VAIGRLAVGALALRRARIKTLMVEDLTVGRLRIRDLIVEDERRSAMTAGSPNQTREPVGSVRSWILLPSWPGQPTSEGSTNMEHKATQGLYGWITHTDIISSDPEASKTWCAKIFGWEFKPSMPTASGDYHLFAYADQGGGGIRAASPAESPASVPFVHVANARAAFDQAIREGATEVTAPHAPMEGVTIAVVRAPGGFLIGLSGP
jgi:predicted enzyme related to lactoylglutathione lyase